MESAVVTLKIIPTVYAYIETWIVESVNDRVIFKDNNGCENDEAATLRFEVQYVPEGMSFLKRHMMNFVMLLFIKIYQENGCDLSMAY